MGALVDFLLVGRKALGSAIRAVVVAILLTFFWTLFIVTPWQLFSVSLITSLAVVAAAHVFSRRDDSSVSPDV